MMQCKLLGKKSKLKAKTLKGTMAAGVDSFGLLDNEDGSFSVLGVSGGGNTVDISDVATLAVTSADTSIITVDPPTGMTFVAKAVKPAGTADVEAVATWNDGSKGPFAETLHGEVKAGPVTGIVVDFTGVTPH